MITVNRTYTTVTPESAIEGDFAECGFISENEPMTFRELVELMKYGEPSCSHDRTERTWVSYSNHQDYSTGEETEESVHFADEPRKAKYWVKALELAGL